MAPIAYTSASGPTRADFGHRHLGLTPGARPRRTPFWCPPTGDAGNPLRLEPITMLWENYQTPCSPVQMSERE